MKGFDDRQLDQVVGATTQHEVFDFVERVPRDAQRIYDQRTQTTCY